MLRSVYIISGPAGIGKSTTSRKLVEHLDRSSYISGDDISHLPVNGRGKPWICQETHKLTWTNILSLVKNLIEFNYDVVLDYVTFPSEANWLACELERMNVNVRVVYVVFMVDHETIIRRDQLRDPSIQMGERSVILLNEFIEALKDERHILNTQDYSVDQLEEVIEEILNNNRFLIS
ncbi:AAA family ATPase [Paenibacillus sp. FSL K6-0108]|uniref:AAA family ATPase n=1 Tax=Paenibacillus sp. FSL K6-0108 TaxID=2921417 RepID=UPI0032471C24